MPEMFRNGKQTCNNFMLLIKKNKLAGGGVDRGLTKDQTFYVFLAPLPNLFVTFQQSSPVKISCV